MQESDILKKIKNRDWLLGLVIKSIQDAKGILGSLPESVFDISSIEDVAPVINELIRAQRKLEEASRRASLVDCFGKNLDDSGVAEAISQIDMLALELSELLQAYGTRKKSLLRREEFRKLKADQLLDAESIIDELETISMRSRNEIDEIRVACLKKKFERNFAREQQNLMEKYWAFLDKIYAKVGYEIA